MSIGNSSPTVRNCIFVNNWMGSAYNEVQGGAVAVENGGPTFTYCSFINNRVRYFGPPPGFGANGGAVYCRDSSLQFTSCTFQSNAAFGVGYSGGGGAVSCVGSSLTVDDCSFIENSADLEGGALSVSGSDVTLDNTTLASNVAGGTAGGIVSAGSILQVTNSTFSGNAAVEGGGLFFTSSNVLMEKTIVAFSEGGGAIRCTRRVRMSFSVAAISLGIPVGTGLSLVSPHSLGARGTFPWTRSFAMRPVVTFIFTPIRHVPLRTPHKGAASSAPWALRVVQLTCKRMLALLCMGFRYYEILREERRSLRSSLLRGRFSRSLG